MTNSRRSGMTSTTEIKIYKTPKLVAESFAEELYQFVKNSHRPVHIALSGGSTPALLFDVLAQDYAEKMPWEKIHFWWGDERCVPPSDNESNYKMTFDHLFSKITVLKDQVHRVRGEMTPADANTDYISEIERYVPQKKGWPVFDLIILGMGNDGHTASIFPHQPELLESDEVCAVATHPESGQKRVTLTGKVLNNAGLVYFLVTGLSKKERVAEILNKKDGAEKLPSFHIQPNEGKLVFFFDSDAASGLNS